MLQTYEVKGDATMLEELMTAEQVRRLLKVATLPRALPVVRVGRLIRIKASDLRAYIDQHRERRM